MSTSKPPVVIEPGHIGGFKQDPNNARKHNPRNLGMIEHSLNEVGAGRSIVTTRDGTVIAGNATLDAAALAGMENVVVVHTDGKQLLVHVRDDLEQGDERATMLGLYDNRSAELAEWDTDVLSEMAEQFVENPVFDHIFSADDLHKLMGGDGSRVIEQTEPQLGDFEYRVIVECTDEEDQARFMEDLEAQGRIFKAMVS